MATALTANQINAKYNMFRIILFVNGIVEDNHTVQGVIKDVIAFAIDLANWSRDEVNGQGEHVVKVFGITEINGPPKDEVFSL